jgi:hypothetical protein
MRSIAKSAVVLLALAAGILVASPAHAIDAVNVLTTGSLGGPNVAVNDTVSSGLKSGTTANFFTTATGSTGVKCSVSQFTASILTNPGAGGIATENLTGQTFPAATCTTNVAGTSRVNSITINNLPYSATVNGTSKVLTVTAGAAGPIQASVSLQSFLGAVNCTYRLPTGVTSFTGNASNTDNSLTFTNVQFSKSAGSGLCPGSSFFSATYAPAQDTTVAGSPLVFVQ